MYPVLSPPVSIMEYDCKLENGQDITSYFHIRCYLLAIQFIDHHIEHAKHYQ